jgi:hypothetical protein
MNAKPSKHDHGGLPDAPFESLGRLVAAAASVEEAPAADAALRARFVEAAHRGPRRRAGLWLGGLGFVGAGAALLLVARGGPVTYEVAGSSADGRVTGAAGAASIAGPSLPGGALVRFSEGTEIELTTASAGRVAEATSDGARLILDDGALTARVKPRRGARWAIEAGPFTVRVTGTSFLVRWQRRAGRFAIGMRTGSVMVEGPGFSQKLAAGQRLEATIDAGITSLGEGPLLDEAAASPAPPPVILPLPAPAPPAAPAAAPSPEASGRTASPARHGASLARPSSPSPSRPSTWSRLLTEGDFAGVVSAAESEGLDAVAARRGLDDLSALAAAARFARRPDLARRALEAQRRRFGQSPAGREAAFHLGRLADDEDRDRRAAVGWYERYLVLAPNGALAAEALGRKILALEALKDADRGPIEAAARQYLERFPAGAHARAARNVLGR